MKPGSASDPAVLREACCWQCALLEFFPGDPGQEAYSEVTPGYGMTEPVLRCKEGHWDVNVFEDVEAQFRQKIMSARTCQDFSDYNPAIRAAEPKQ